MRSFMVAGMVVMVAAPAAAQLGLPETSRSESQATASSRALMQQGQARDAAGQTQFEINSLRTGASRTVTPPVVAPPIAGPAPAPIR